MTGEDATSRLRHLDLFFARMFAAAALGLVAAGPALMSMDF